MVNKNNVVSILLFSISSILFVIFAFTIFFGGQKIGGSIYFIYFVIMLAFTAIDKKYSSNFIYFYRFSTYLSDAFNVLAVSSLIYYHIFLPYSIASCSILGVCFFVDLFAKNRIEKRRLGSILVGVFNCTLMFSIFPYFFLEEYSMGFAVFMLVLSICVFLGKLTLALVPYPKQLGGEKEENNSQAADDIVSHVTNQDDEQNVE